MTKINAPIFSMCCHAIQMYKSKITWNWNIGNLVFFILHLWLIGLTELSCEHIPLWMNLNPQDWRTSFQRPHNKLLQFPPFWRKIAMISRLNFLLIDPTRGPGSRGGSLRGGSLSYAGRPTRNDHFQSIASVCVGCIWLRVVSEASSACYCATAVHARSGEQASTKPPLLWQWMSCRYCFIAYMERGGLRGRCNADSLILDTSKSSFGIRRIFSRA